MKTWLPIAGSVLLLIACPILAADQRVTNNASTAAPAVALPKLDTTGLADIPPAKEVPPAALKDDATTAEKAFNYQRVLRFLGLKPSEKQRTFLNANKFLLIPIKETHLKPNEALGDWADDMLAAFDAIGGGGDVTDRKPENARLVTPDVMLHAFHKFLENALEELEGTELSATLKGFLTAVQTTALKQKDRSGSELARRFETLAAQWSVPLILLQNETDTATGAKEYLARLKPKFSPEAIALMSRELELIYAANGTELSPLFGFYDARARSDYTQFQPRSHYTKTPLLRAYFRAMMYLGRNGYILNSSSASDRTRGVSDSLLAAYVLSAARKPDGEAILPDWQRIMAITGFYAGPPDDLTFPEWRDFITGTLRTDAIRPEMALDSATLDTLLGNLEQLRPPAILGDAFALIRPNPRDKAGSATPAHPQKTFRLFGQRFSLDAWILGRLTDGSGQGENSALPRLPSALFIPAAFGSRAAASLSEQFLTQTAGFTPSQVAGFQSVLQQVRPVLAGMTDRAWFASASTQWLRVLESQTLSFGDGYPLYMRGDGFGTKQLQTLLGSYAELKHDTLLYAKQSYAELGSGEEDRPPPPVPKGFVEPNLRFWYELQRLVHFTIAGFKKYKLLPITTEEYGSLERFAQTVDFCTDLSEKETRGTALSEDEYEKLRVLDLDFMAQPLEAGKILNLEQRRVALIADIYTDAVDGKIVYEATGQPYVMLALIGNERTPRLTIGLALNHYELTGPLESRLSDEDWKQKVYRQTGRLPKKNFWYEGLFPP